MIYMEQKHLDTVLAILKKYPYTFYAFGSRVKGTQRTLSDLDVCFIENIPLNIRAHIREDFDESNLPFTIDLVDWNACSDEFKQRILEHRVLLQDANKKAPVL